MKNDAAAKVQAASQKLTDATNEANADSEFACLTRLIIPLTLVLVNGAKSKLDQAQTSMRNFFGNVDRQIQDARNAVQSAQSKCGCYIAVTHG